MERADELPVEILGCLIDKAAGAELGPLTRVVPLMIVGGGRQRHDDGGNSGRCQLGQRRTATAANDQVRLTNQAGRVVQKWGHACLDVQRLIALGGGNFASRSRLMDDFPLGKQLFMVCQSQRHKSIERRSAETAAEHQQQAPAIVRTSFGCPRWIALDEVFRPHGSARNHKSDVLSESTSQARVRAANPSCGRSQPARYLSRPGVHFQQQGGNCPILRCPHDRGAGVTAQSHDQRNAFPLQHAPGSEIPRKIGGDKPRDLFHAAGRRGAGKYLVSVWGVSEQSPLQGLAGAGKRDLQSFEQSLQAIGHDQPGHQVARGPSAGKDDVWGGSMEEGTHRDCLKVVACCGSAATAADGCERKL